MLELIARVSVYRIKSKEIKAELINSLVPDTLLSC